MVINRFSITDKIQLGTRLVLSKRGRGTNFSVYSVVYFWNVIIAKVIPQKCWWRGEGVHLEIIFNEATSKLYPIIVSLLWTWGKYVKQIKRSHTRKNRQLFQKIQPLLPRQINLPGRYGRIEGVIRLKYRNRHKRKDTTKIAILNVDSEFQPSVSILKGICIRGTGFFSVKKWDLLPFLLS